MSIFASPSPSKMNTPIAKNWCRTQTEVETSTYVWTIDNFSIYQDMTGEVLESSTFSSATNDEWRLELLPKGIGEKNKCFLSLFLVLAASKKVEVRAKFKFSILNARREEARATTYTIFHRFLPGTNVGFNRFVRRDDLFNVANGLLPDDKLTIVCEMSVVENRENISGQTKSVQFKLPDRKLSDHFEVLFENQEFTDITLSVGGRELQAHKAILAARSPVFAAMFKHDMKENKLNRVEIADVDYEVLKEMLRFIYTDKALNLGNMAANLLAVADKYALDRLKVMCEEALCTNLSILNAADIFILADIHSAHQLKARTVQFIQVHAKHVIETTGWKSMIKTHPHLMAEPFRAVVTQLSPPVGPPRKRLKPM